MASNVSRGPSHWPELDHLRFLAVMLMVVNHVAVESPVFHASRVVGAIGFLGGFAPVLFFFATGVGYGVQSVSRAAPHGRGYLVKVAILVACDLDFLTFIGLSMLVLEWVRKARRSGLVALSLALALIVGRYAVGPMLPVGSGARVWGVWVEYLLGTAVIPALGYAVSPWMAYPLLGFAVGRIAVRHPGATEKRARLAFGLIALAGPFVGLALVLGSRGAYFFRYGTMSAAYFLSSVAVVLVGLAVVLWLARVRAFPGLVGLFTLSGIRSFAVVPLHYWLLWLVSTALGSAHAVGSIFGTALAVLVLSVAGSALVVSAAGAVDSPGRRRVAWVAVIGLVVAYHLWIKGWVVGPSLLFARTALQLSLCVLLALHRPSAVRPSPRQFSEPRTRSEPVSA